MRIISGSHRGRKLKVPSVFNSRPTTDQARESLFNVLGNHFNLNDVSVLDLFCGTGAVSFEFASRGTQQVTSVDLNKRLCTFLKEQATFLGFDAITIVKANAFDFITSNNRSYDIIFADPPFELKGLEGLPDLIFDTKRLNESGLFVLEHAKKHTFTSHPNFSFEKKYGSVHFSFFHN